MALMQRDAAIVERNGAIFERGASLSAIQYRESIINSCKVAQESNITCFQPEHQQLPRQPVINNCFPLSSSIHENSTDRKLQPDNEAVGTSSKKIKSLVDDLSKQIIAASSYGWEDEQTDTGCEHASAQVDVSKHQWKDYLGLNSLEYDDATMLVPICSCMGIAQLCSEWGNGGWQSACCTTTLSMWMPQLPNKLGLRVHGKKMSGSVFNTLFSLLAVDGHDLSTPIDLKDHWAKHGSNCYNKI